MGLIQDAKDALTEVQLSPVMQQRVALAEQETRQEAKRADQAEKRNGELERENDSLKRRIAGLEKENAGLREQRAPSAPSEFVPNHVFLSEDTLAVLIALFKAEDRDDTGVTALANVLKMSRGVLRYHLDQLDKYQLAQLGSVDPVDSYWYLTPAGRARVVREDLAS